MVLKPIINGEYKQFIVLDNLTSFEAHGTGSQLSSRVSSMIRANGLLELPGSSEKIKTLKIGDVVQAYIIGQL